MKFKLKKKKLKNLSLDNKAIPLQVTNKIAGGNNGNAPETTATIPPLSD